jgi:hypothetical protein
MARVKCWERGLVKWASGQWLDTVGYKMIRSLDKDENEILYKIYNTNAV